MFLLGKQLKSLRPQTDMTGSSPYLDRSQKGEGFREDEPTTSGVNLQYLDRAAEIEDNGASNNGRRTGAESPMESLNMPRSPSTNSEANLLRSPINSNNSKHRYTMSSSVSSSSIPTPEKQSRGFRRLFSSQGKNGY